MDIVDLNAWPLFAIVLMFVAASGVVWFGGTRLSKYADALAARTGVGRVAVGTMLLGGVTSLPEVATTITASSRGEPEIAVNNLLGGVALQVTILVAGDIALGRRSISAIVGSTAVQLQGIVCIILLSLSACIMLLEDVAVGPVGLGAILILVVVLAGFYLVTYMESINWWDSPPKGRTSIDAVKSSIKNEGEVLEEGKPDGGRESFSNFVQSPVFFYLLFSALAVLAGGYAVVRSGEMIATKTGIGSSLVGAVLLACSTSLPELSTTISAIRLKEYKLAFSNIFGTNILTVGLIFLADVLYSGGPILNEVGEFSIFAAVLGIAVTALYLMGLTVRFKKTFFNMGYDSVIVLLTYLSGVYLMFTMFDV